jgi:hypothetical protein
VQRYDRLRDALRNAQGPIFIKPAKGWKRFTGFVVDHADDPRFNGASKNLPVWTAEPVTLLSEWRAYVAYGTVRAIQFADHGGARAVRPDESSIHAAVATLVSAGIAPAGFVIDFGVDTNGRTLLIEMNDGFSVGAYDGLDADAYWAVTAARWFEMME